MSDIFESVASKYRGSPSVLFLFIVSFVMLSIGINHFIEDVYSSYEGLISIERHFNLNVQVYSWTYWTMSLAPQIASVVYAYIYLSDTDKSYALWVSIGCQFVDFLSDLWFRSNGSAFTDWGATGVSALITLAFFTLGSEVFVSVGFGLCLKLFSPALSYFRQFRKELKKSRGESAGGEVEKPMNYHPIVKTNKGVKKSSSSEVINRNFFGGLRPENKPENKYE